MLDVHVLLMDYTLPEYHEQCKASIQVAVEQAGFPVSVHYLPGVYGHLGEARYRGYSLGNHPYVTHVDDDDFLSPDAFSALRAQLEAGANAITTGESWVVDGKVVKSMEYSRHHLAVYRRDLMVRVPYRHFKFYPDQFLMRQIPSEHIPQCLYYLRMRDDSGSRRCRREHPEEAERELKLLDRPDLVAAEALTKSQIDSLYDEWIAETP